MSGIRHICYDLEARSGNDTMDRSPNAACVVRDPTVVRTKGAPSTRGHKGRKRKCTRCRKTGHTKRRCTEPQKISTLIRYKHCPKKETKVSKLKAVSPHFNLHANQGKRLEEGDDSRSEQDGGANDRWDHVIGTVQSQTRNMGGVGNTVDWNIEVIDLWLGIGNIAVVTRSLLKVLSTWCSLYRWKNVLYVTNFLSVLNFLGLYSVNPADAQNRAAASKLA
ncbi:hypothetical protein Ahy_B05g075591 [Arachis hypogaea]|uniref:CCHC-type domain-containing protein n=1 Tax=Arachis hypogaea TaxID=3818 RepID=A0A444Z1H4_ARAHY|nr:hypothetical protein Ahy_B05g075591 [Arachis hypogaea]